MLFDKIMESLSKFSADNFDGALNTWGVASDVKTTSIDWSSVENWMIFFVILFIAIVLLLSKSRIIEKLSKHILSLSLVVWFIGVFIYIIGFYNSEVNGLSVVLRAIISSFKMFVVSSDLARIPQFLQNDPSYMTAFSLVHFAAAFTMFLFIFKMLGYKIKSSFRIISHMWLHSKGKVVHLFWGVNEASCLLAEDIRRNHDAATIIFVDIDKEDENGSQKKTSLGHITNTITIKNNEIARLETIGALVDHCYNGPASIKGDNSSDIFGILHLKNIGTIVRKCSKAYIYFLSDDEAQNIAGALNMRHDQTVCTIGNNKPVIYIHARRDTDNEIFDHFSHYDHEASNTQIKIVDSAYLAITKLKHDKKALPVNCVNIDKSHGTVNSPFTALIVGFGETGQEAFKFLYEYSAFIGPDMNKTPFKCYAVDSKMDNIAGLLREKMPAICEDELLLIHAGVDSQTFWSIIHQIINKLNYIVIAINNDEIGLLLTTNIFNCALSNRPSELPALKIMVRCYNNNNEKRMSEVAKNLNKSADGSNVEIQLFGLEKDLYCCNTILSETTFEEAKEFNRVYNGSRLSAPEQWALDFGEEEVTRLITKKNMLKYHAIHDINRRIAQNISDSLHRQTKMILMGLDDTKESDRLKRYYEYVKTREFGTTTYKCNPTDTQLLRNIAMVEHERWIASHKLMGYTHNIDNDYVKKHHQCICPWDDLDEMIQSYDYNVVDTTIKMEYDKRFNS